MTVKTDDFFDIPSGGYPASETSVQNADSFFDIPSPYQKPQPPSTIEQLKTAPAIFSQEFLSGLWSLPSMTAEAYRFLAGKAQEFGEQQAAQQGKEPTEANKNFTSVAVNALPDLVKWLGEKAPALFPTYQQAKKKVGEKIRAGGGELPEEPRGAIERGASGAGKAGQILAFPGSALLKGAAIGTSAASEALDLPGGYKIGANLTIPALTSIIQSILTKKYTPPRGVAENLYKEGKRLGMTDEQLAPILATEGQVQRYGRLAADVPATRKGFEAANESLGNVIETMQNRPANFNALPQNVEDTLVRKLEDLERDIRGRTHALSPKETQYADFLKDTIDNIYQNGSTPRQLIGTTRSINKIGAGKTELRRAMEPIKEAIEAVDPQLAADLEATNALYSRYIKNIQEINPGQFNAFIDAGELQQVLGAVFSGNLKSATQSTLNIASLGTLRRISSAMLTDPRAQSLARNFGKAVRDGRQASARALGIQFQHYVQENLPEDYKEINWDTLLSEKKSNPSQQPKTK